MMKPEPIDIRMPRMDGVEATSRLVASGHKVLVLTTFDLDEYLFSAIKAGASGFLLKDVPPDDLAAVVRDFGPGPGARLGVLVDHLVPGSKEARLAASVDDPHVLVTGTPFVDVWQAVKPAVVGIPAFLTLITIPLTFSIANGLAFGVIAYALLKLATRRIAKVDWLLFALAGLFVARFVYMAFEA
jgi:CheY-like chemotaxis protein